MMLNSNIADLSSAAGTANPSGAVHFLFVWGFCCSIDLVFCVIFCRSLFVLLSFFIW